MACRLHHQGWSIRQIAKQLNSNRRTVTKYIELETLKPQQGYQRSKQYHPALGAFIDSSCISNSYYPINQRRSAQQYYEHLQSIGFTGSYSAVRRFVATSYKQQPLCNDWCFYPFRLWSRWGIPIWLEYRNGQTRWQAMQSSIGAIQALLQPSLLLVLLSKSNNWNVRGCPQSCIWILWWNR